MIFDRKDPPQWLKDSWAEAVCISSKIWKDYQGDRITIEEYRSALELETREWFQNVRKLEEKHAETGG
jgi:hypothetical protein